MDVSIMIEGQMGLNWPRWRAVASDVERLGFAGLYRSDHFLNAAPPDDDSLEAVVSLAYLATATSRIRFGPLVSPVSFRDPVMLARQAAALGDLSGGRFILGVGAGWSTREHDTYGYDLLDVPSRMARLEEALTVAAGLLRNEGPTSFDGRFYRLRGATVVPRGPVPLLVGGNGERYTVPLAARFADVWNAVILPADAFAERCERLEELARAAGREPSSIRRTMMTGVYTGSRETLDARVARTRARAEGASVSDVVAMLRERGALAGTYDELPEQIAALEKAGCEEVMLQWLWLDDLEGLAGLAEVLV